MNIQKLPVVNFAAGGIATPADAALMMKLGSEGVFVGSGIFKSNNLENIRSVFIRAPYISEYDENVDILCKVNNVIVAAKEKNILVSSFHPELTDDLSFLDYFINNFCS